MFSLQYKSCTHMKGLTPVWSAWCTVRCWCLVNDFRHPSSWHCRNTKIRFSWNTHIIATSNSIFFFWRGRGEGGIPAQLYVQIAPITNNAFLKDFCMIQYNLSTPDLVYSGFLSNPAKYSGPNNFPIYLNVKNTSVIWIL